MADQTSLFDVIVEPQRHRETVCRACGCSFIPTGARGPLPKLCARCRIAPLSEAPVMAIVPEAESALALADLDFGGEDEGSRLAQLGNRVRSFLHTTPLHDLVANRGMHADWGSYCMATLGFAALEKVIDSMGLDGGATFEEVVAYVAETAARMDDKAPPGLRERVAREVLEALVNRDDPQGAERLPYADLTSDETPAPVRYESVRLIVETMAADNSIVLTASSPAVTLYLRGFSLDIADHQVASEALLESLVKQRRLGRAQAVAEQARIASIGYSRKVRRWKALADRDIRQLDWSATINSEIDAIYYHLSEAIEREKRILGNLESIVEGLEDNVDLTRNAATLRESIDGCLVRHSHLHREIMTARRVFLTAHRSQALRPPPALTKIELNSEIARPLLRLPTADALDVALVFAIPAIGGMAPLTLHLDSLLSSLLAPPREAEDPGEVASVPTLVRREPVRRFTTLEQRAVYELLAFGIGGPISLSTLLVRARAMSTENVRPQAVTDLLALVAQSALERDGARFVLEDGRHFRVVAAPTGQRFSDERHAGDDVRITCEVLL